MKPGIVLNNAGSPWMSILAWGVGGIITLASALSVAEIAAAIPKSGGLYTYLSELYGGVFGYLLGWVQAVISYPASVAALAIAFATYSGYFLPLSAWQQKLLAVGILAFILLMNVIATKFGGIIQTVATVGKLIPVAGIVGVGLFSDLAPGFGGIGTAAAGAGFGAAVLGTLWAYDGWISVTNMAGEIKDPARTLPKVISIGVIFLLSLCMCCSILRCFRRCPMTRLCRPRLREPMRLRLCSVAAAEPFITAGIIVSVLGALNGYLMTAARVPQAMGERGQIPFSRVLSSIHPKFQTPANALVFFRVCWR
ncbi:APC family permease [Paenibacillus rhizoplanae]